MLPESLTFTKTLHSGEDKGCYSVNMTADGHLICGLQGGVEIWNTREGKIKDYSIIEHHMFDVKQYGDQLYAAWKHDEQLTIVRYDRQLTNGEEVVSIPYYTNFVTKMDVRYGTIAVVYSKRKLVKLYTTDGEFVRDVKLIGCKAPYGVRLLMDGCVLVTDYCAGSVAKYQTDGSGRVVWRCAQLQRASGLDVDEWGIIYICGGTNIYVLSPKGRYDVITSSHAIPIIAADADII